MRHVRIYCPSCGYSAEQHVVVWRGAEYLCPGCSRRKLGDFVPWPVFNVDATDKKGSFNFEEFIWPLFFIAGLVSMAILLVRGVVY